MLNFSSLDKSDSDEEDGPTPGKYRNKWRMVLNIKKLEHAVSHSEPGTRLPPESPLAKTKPTSPHQSFGDRIVSSYFRLCNFGVT